MVTVRNHAKERLQAGELVLGVGLRQARHIALAGFVQVWVDPRAHQPVDLHALAADILDDVLDHADRRHNADRSCRKVAGLARARLPARGQRPNRDDHQQHHV